MDDILEGLAESGIWVFGKQQTSRDLGEYVSWCLNYLKYTPTCTFDLICFRNKSDLILFKLTFPELL